MFLKNCCILLAIFFDCTLDELAGRVSVETPTHGKGLTPQENALINAYGKLDDKQRQQAINVVSALKI